MSEFKIKPVTLKADHSFLSAHKQKKEHAPEDDAFQRYKDYKTKITVLFSDLPQEHKFWLQNGESVKNLHDLYTAFDLMPDAVFFHHANGERNDFVEWVKHVYQDDELAYKILRAKSKDEAKSAIEERIDELTDVGTHKDDKSFFTALIDKFSRQNAKLEEELAAKKDFLAKKQKEMERWELKNLEHEKMLFTKYKHLEGQEQELYAKFRKLQDQEEELNQALVHERQEIRNESSTVTAAHRAVERERAEIERQRQDLEKSRREHTILAQQVMMKKHEPIYGRLDELMSYTSTCIFNKNYKEARDSMSKIRYYYSTLPHTDPRKKEFYMKIIALRTHINEELRR